MSLGLHMAADFDLLGGDVGSMDVEKLSRDQFAEFMDAAAKRVNGQVNLILGELSLPTTDRGHLLDQAPQMGDWESATELSRGRREKTGGRDGVGFPLEKFIKRSGWSRDYLAKVPNLELMRHFMTVMNSYKVTNWKRAMRALFNDSEYDWSHDLFPEDAVLTVKPLLNADGYIPPSFGQNEFDGTESHYVALGAGTFDQTDLVTLADNLRRFGFGVSPNSGGMGGRIEVWVHADEVADVKGHADFIPPEDVTVVDINKIYAEGLGLDDFIGYNSTARAFIRQVDYVPSGYILAFATNSMASASQFDARVNSFAPLRRREPSQANLRGIRRIDETRYPLEETFWENWHGYGAFRRYSACIGQLAGSYTAPTIT